ncbi:NADP-dependent dehydrogenase-like protein [Phialemonium atrogriseum]|uniref:NADP-dependent dehydrogenase-like protein n=1 Tax=Phialemonium atrogriseum TaxID=1093897 RepID=A0AAJ0BQS9_9PEZI|nr:NADP-dependent dehydrogenase-like protein [Phialemonium atrogriseum]KAK1762332.1 NADP-dependent dehydrogenase-like protein [Phialemonium atrogriseum]
MTVYVITGARAGIGLEYVRQLATSPSNTVFAVIRSLTADITTLTALQQDGPGKVHIIECDVSSETSISTLTSKLSSTLGTDTKIDVLINNAAILHSRQETSLTLSSDALLSHITTNVIGPAKVLQAVLPLLADGAVVANITSGIGSLAMLTDGRINAEITPYSISKTALNMLTVHQARHLRGRAVVVCVDPGHVKTEMGGPEAVVEVGDSARGVLGTLASLTMADTGKFLLYNGTGLPW